MHTVILDGDVSYPPTSGKRLRTLNLMLQLAPRQRITYLARGDARSQNFAAAERFLRERHIEPVLIDDPLPAKKGPLFYARLAANVVSSWPYSVTSHQSARVREVVAKFAASHQVDVWQVEWSGYIPMLPPSARPRVLIGHNVDTLIWQRYYETARGLARRLFLHGQWKKYERFERWALHQVERVVAVSPEDAVLMRERFGQPNVDVVDNGIDRAYFENVHGTRDPKRILFLGALDWRPNLDGLDLLLAKIFPMVRAQEPTAHLVIVGRHPPRSLMERIAGSQGVELHADVPDVRPYLAEAGVLAVPLRIGGGSRLKILEALACGLPVVSTRVGAEGLALVAGEHYVRSEEDAMAQALVGVLRTSEAAQAQARLARELVLRTYDWAVLARKLEAVWERADLANTLDGARGCGKEYRNGGIRR